MKAPAHLAENPLIINIQRKDRISIVNEFPIVQACNHSYYLFLRKYLLNYPHKLFDRDSYQIFLSWLNNRQASDSIGLNNYLTDHENTLNQAFLFLEEINNLGLHDSMVKSDDYNYTRFIDQQLHSNYLKLIEAILIPFIRIIAYFSRIDRKAGTDGLDVWQVIQEVRKTELSKLTLCYNHVVRNAIAHGGITYLQREIRYRDKKENELVLGLLEIIKLFDDLIDTCNAISCAYKVFFLSYSKTINSIPRQVLIEELAEETKAPWWTIDGYVQSELREGKQLIIYIKPNTNDIGKVKLSAFQTGILAEFLASGYIRYFLSFHSDKTGPGWAVFDGLKLKNARNKKDTTIMDYQGVLENDLVFFTPNINLPSTYWKFHNFIYTARLLWPLHVNEIFPKSGKISIIIRNTEIHRSLWGCVLKAGVVMNLDGNLDPRILIKNSCKRILREAIKKAKKRLGRAELIRYLPIAFASIAVFRKDYRKRRLESFGLGADLVCTIQLQRAKRINQPDIFQSTVEFYNGYKIAWNKAWLEQISS